MYLCDLRAARSANLVPISRNSQKGVKKLLRQRQLKKWGFTTVTTRLDSSWAHAYTHRVGVYLEKRMQGQSDIGASLHSHMIKELKNMHLHRLVRADTRAVSQIVPSQNSCLIRLE